MFIPESRILIFTHPGSQISDPGSKNSYKREGWKKLVVTLFFVATNFTKYKIILFLNCWRKNFWAKFKRIIELFTQKAVTKLSKIWVWDSRSGIRDPEKTYSRSRIQRSKRHQFPDPDPQHWTIGTYSTAVDSRWRQIAQQLQLQPRRGHFTIGRMHGTQHNQWRGIRGFWGKYTRQLCTCTNTST